MGFGMIELAPAAWWASLPCRKQSGPIGRGTGQPFFSFYSPHDDNYFLPVMRVSGVIKDGEAMNSTGAMGESVDLR